VTGARLLGVGEYRPARLVSNDELARRVDTSDEWIRARTGIRTRRVADADESVVAMGVAAGAKALAAAGVDAAGIDLVLAASCTLPSQIPGAGPEIAARLGAVTAGAVDVNGGCAGFCYALGFAADAVRAGSARTVLVVASERLSDYTDWDDRSTCILFGDGSGAVVVGPAETDEIGPVAWGHDGTRPEAIAVRRDDPFLRMDGQAVFRWAGALAPHARRACDLAGVDPADLAAFVPHQANLRIVDAIAKRLGATRAVVARDVVDAGNTSAASVPLALARMIECGELRRGDPVLMFGYGAGLTFAGQVVRCP
jgi:3-oxoacyl-[acyl-carrier-protein] synthase-3